MKRLLSITVSAAMLAASAQAAPQVMSLGNFDSTFGGSSGLCAGTTGDSFDCEQAVAEFRNGDNGTTAAQAEVGIGANTGPGVASTINISGTSGFWDGNVGYGFELVYDASTDTLTFGVDQNQNTTLDVSEQLTYNVGLSDTESMFIRLDGRAGANQLSNLSLNGDALGTIDAMGGVEYVQISDFDWNADWQLFGTVTMAGDAAGPGSRPSIQFKLTDLQAVPVPAAAFLFVPALGLMAARRKRST